MSPSASLATPEQVNVVLVVTPVLGVILAAVSKTGAVLSTVTEADDVSLSPAESVIVAVQVSSSVGLELLSVTVNVEPVPSVDPELSVQVYVGVRLPSS